MIAHFLSAQEAFQVTEYEIPECMFDETAEMVSQHAFEMMSEQKVGLIEYWARRLGTPLFLKLLAFKSAVVCLWHKVIIFITKQNEDSICSSVKCCAHDA